MRILLFLVSLVFSLGLNAKTLVLESVTTNNEHSIDFPVYNYFIGDVDFNLFNRAVGCKVFLSDTVPLNACGVDINLTAKSIEYNPVNDVGKRTKSLKSLNSEHTNGYLYRRSRDGLQRTC